MIVISGALVLVALVLLVVGLAMPELDFVYASIAVSLLAFVFLVIGILQRRGEQAPAAASSPAPSGETPTSGTTQVVAPAPVDVSKRPAPEAEPPLEEDDVDEELLEGGGIVLVVAGRPRYHVDGCRYLNGKDVEEVDVLDARDEGFTPCGVCKPDEVLAAELAEEAEEGDLVDEEGLAEEDQLVTEEALAPTAEEELDEDDEDDLLDEDDDEEVGEALEADVAAARAEEPAPTRTLSVPVTAPAAKAGSRRVTAAPATKAAAAPAKAAAKAPARSVAARAVPAAAKAPAKAPGAVAAPAKAPAKVPSKAATKAPSKAPAKAKAASPARAAAAASTPAAATAAKKGTVVVIPDRGRFHKPDCRYVRDADDALELSRAAATKQGYAACGVCKP